ncbi:hypothetical protein [Lonepinella sp. BR2357]|uniref:hypothetical protein n=1 Tax=Lonepinella sp. BR2357 TaxID=3434549 RepID=UPI003F6DF464
MKPIVKISILSLSILSAACESGYSVLYDSFPQSAKLICNGQDQGYTPRYLSYSTKDKVHSDGYLKTWSCYALWTSGARAKYQNYFSNVYIRQYPDGVELTAQRPQNYPNFAVDMQTDNMRKNAPDHTPTPNFWPTYQAPRTTYCNRYGTQVLCNTY